MPGKSVPSTLIYVFNIQWGFNKACIKVDAPTSLLSVAGKDIFKVRIADYTLNLQWFDGEWENWDSLQASTELAAIKSSAQQKLNNSKAANSKGKGKGPNQE